MASHIFVPTVNDCELQVAETAKSIVNNLEMTAITSAMSSIDVTPQSINPSPESITLNIHHLDTVKQIVAPSLKKLKCADLNALLGCNVLFLRLTLLDHSTHCIWPRSDGRFSNPQNDDIPIIKIEARSTSDYPHQNVRCVKCKKYIRPFCRRVLNTGDCRYGRYCSFLHPTCHCTNAVCWRDHVPIKKTCFRCKGFQTPKQGIFVRQTEIERDADEFMQEWSMKMRPRHRAWMKESTAFL